MSSPILTIRNLHATVDGKEILRGLDLDVGTGEVAAVMGPNGSGKSTLSYVLAGSDGYAVTAGETVYKGRNLADLKDRVLRQRWAAIARAHDAKVFGIIVSKKNGQVRMDMAKDLKALAERHGRQANLFLLDLVSPEFLEGYRVDACVNTACPRSAIEDVLQYKQPMLTPQEFEIVLGERKPEAYAFDEIRAY